MELNKFFTKTYLEERGFDFKDELQEDNCEFAQDSRYGFLLLYKEIENDENSIETIKRIKNKFNSTYYWFYVKDKNAVYLYRTLGENRYILLTEKLKGEARKQRVEDLKNLSWDTIDRLFDTKLVFNSFYVQLQSFRIKLALEIKKYFIDNDIENIDGKCVSLAQRIIDRIIFIYFLGEKGGLYWIEGNSKLSAKDFFSILKESNSNFYNELKKVFFNYFNTEYDSRNELNYIFDENTSFKIPYLNGGLFMPQKNIRGFEEEDISISSSFEWFDLIDLLNSYTWIIRDEVPNIMENEYEGNLTPDILGHLYEKFVITLELLGDDFTIEDWNEAIKKNKGKDIKQIGNKKVGAYYTPEEITTYMCKNTIVPFLLDKLKKKKIKISEDKLIKILENCETESEEILRVILKELSSIKICDPACGSGAFLLKAFEKLHFYICTIKKKLNEDTNYYQVAKDIISNSIYGVDIMEGAIEIAKLRLWLTLISYSEEGEFEPLLNIDYKIRRGNSLIGFDDVSVLTSGKNLSLSNWLGGQEKIFNILREVEKEKEKFLEEHGEKATQLGKEIEKKLEPLRDELDKEFFNEKLKELSLRDDEKSEIKSDIFHWNLEFIEVFKPEQGGFDIIIGNPPYLMFVNIKEKYLLEVYRKLFQTYHGISDIYTLFYEKSYEISNKERLNISLITKNRWNNSESYKYFRNFLKNFNLKIIDFDSLYVFKGSADVNTNIIFIDNFHSNKKLNYYIIKKNYLSLKLKEDFVFKKFNLDNNFDWNFNKNPIISFIENKGKKILDRRTGHLIAPNKIFELKKINNDSYVNKENVVLKPNEEEKEYIKNYLKSSKINKFSCFPDSYTIYLKNGDINELPNIKNYFEKYGSIELDIHEFDSGKGYRSPELNDREIKIVYPNKMYTNKNSCFTLSFNYSVIGRDSFSVFPKINISLKYLLVILNSNLQWYYYINKFKLYQGRITINANEISVMVPINSTEIFFNSLSNILLFTHQIENSKFSNYFYDLSNNLVYELYFKEELQTNLIEMSEKYLRDVNYDDWIKLYFNEEKTPDEMQRQKELEEDNLKIVEEVYNELSQAEEINNEIKNIQSHKWVKTIENELKK